MAGSTATQRREREKLGTALSKQERDESMQCESRALSRIVVISRLIDRGFESLAKVAVGVQTPSLAQDIMHMTGNMNVATATACAKERGFRKKSFKNRRLSGNEKQWQ